MRQLVVALTALGGLTTSLVVPQIGAAASTMVQYHATVTIPAPPSANFSGAGAGGDGWAIVLSSTQLFNVFHHQQYLEVNCHNQSDASTCSGYPKTITDGSGNSFATSVGPGMYLDQSTGHLYVWATRIVDHTAGVACIDTTSSAADPFCGFTATSAVGDAPLDSGSNSGITNPVLEGSQWFAFNEVAGAPSGTKDQMMCFDTATDAACAGQPYALGAVPTLNTFSFVPLIGSVGSELIVQLVGASHTLACFDTTTDTACSGSWPVTVSAYSGAPFALLNASGSATGICDPISGDPCFNLTGAAVATPTGMAATIGTGGTNFLNGPGYVFSARVYVPNTTTNDVECYDYSTSASCVNYPVHFSNLGLLYTVNPDPNRASCFWVNADNGSDQIQNFDAYTGGPCANAPPRVLASSFIAAPAVCLPTSWTSVQVVSPSPSAYTSGTVNFADADGSPVYSTHTLDGTGSANLTDLGPTTPLPQFEFALTGLVGATPPLTVAFTWSAAEDPSCVTGAVNTVPGSPTGVSANAGDGSATVSWSAPASDGGLPVESYTVTASPGGDSCSTTTTSCTVSGLSSGTAYTFTVTATNNNGVSAESGGSGSVVPTTATTITTIAPIVSSAPRAPTDIHATFDATSEGSDSALVSWIDRSVTGGTVVRYVVTSAPGGKRCATTGMSCSVRGLSLGIAYTFTVAASDATGSATSTVASSLASKVDPGSTAIVLKARSIPVTVKCERASCEGVASVTVARRIMRGSKQVGWRHLVLGRTSFRLGTGEQAELRLAETTLGKTLLPRQTKWWLARQPRFHLTLTLKILDGVTTNTAVHLRAR